MMISVSMKMLMPITYAIWVISEIVLAIVKRSHDDGATDRDKSSFKILWGTIAVSIAIGVYFGMQRIGHFFGYERVLSLTGLFLILFGLVIRWIAILTLRRYFTVNVAIASDHKIIDKGLYGYIRHPAYLGGLISFLGLGLTFSNWISLMVIFVPIIAAFIYRITIEEAALKSAFGDDYLEYSKRTKRLLPGIY
jgi:protein-S-isoprenylcysteine O-methyltransferase Ste14